MAIFALVAGPMLADYLQHWLETTRFARIFGRVVEAVDEQRPATDHLQRHSPRAADRVFDQVEVSDLLAADTGACGRATERGGISEREWDHR